MATINVYFLFLRAFFSWNKVSAISINHSILGCCLIDANVFKLANKLGSIAKVKLKERCIDFKFS